MPSHTLPRRTLPLLPLIVLGVALGSLATDVSGQAAPGLRSTTWELPKPAKFWVDLVEVGDELVSYDGKSLVRFSPSGKRLGVLADAGGPYFGSILAKGPSGSRLYVGESQNGTLRSFELATKTWRAITTLEGNYRLVFHPREGERFAYVSARPQKLAEVVRVDTTTGAKKTIAAIPGYSGPLAFDRSGNLYFAPAPLDFGKPALGRIYRWSAAQVHRAITGAALTTKNATLFASKFDNAGDLAFDSEGTLYASDQFSSKTSSILEIGGGTRFARGVFRASGQSMTTLTFVAGQKPFERYAKSAARIWALGADWARGKTFVHRVQPHRPRLVASDANPRPGSTLRYDASGLPARTLAVFLLGTHLVPERPLGPFGARGMMFPDFAIVPTMPILTVVTRADSRGTATLSGRIPNASGTRWTAQVLAGPVQPLVGGDVTSPWVTSHAAAIRVR